MTFASSQEYKRLLYSLPSTVEVAEPHHLNRPEIVLHTFWTWHAFFDTYRQELPVVYETGAGYQSGTMLMARWLHAAMWCAARDRGKSPRADIWALDGSSALAERRRCMVKRLEEVLDSVPQEALEVAHGIGGVSGVLNLFKEHVRTPL